MSSITRKITEFGQSLWLDNIQRSALDSGELKRLIDGSDVRGITSNPTIFNQAIAKSKDYDTALTSLAWAGWDAEKIFWELAVEDIRDACDLFMPLYEQTNGGDGYVSLEESPSIARDTQGSFMQAQQLWARVSRPNLFIKIPATKEGLPAIRRSLAVGINVNITLIFSLQRYAEVMEAYLGALEDRLASGQAIDHITSVASFFVSRVDTKIDSWLDESSPLRGKAAIANTKLAYEAFLKTFTGDRWEILKAKGARLQRPLWASTSTKNPAYPDTMYVDELIGPHTVNTVPPQTLKAVSEHGNSEITITKGVDEARRIADQLEAEGVSVSKATLELEEEGVQSFLDSFNALIETIEKRRSEAVKSIGPLAPKVVKAITKLELENFTKRIWDHDPSLWSKDEAVAREIRNRMGWLELPTKSLKAIREILEFAREIHLGGIRKFLLLGMGGSSLAPEVFRNIFKPADYELDILDSTDPGQILDMENRFPPEETLYIISSKSGSTLEVNALFDYFWERSRADSSRFIAITDPGTPLDLLAQARSFRKTFHADKTIGGRYSALSAFGLVPAALMGLDLENILNHAVVMHNQCNPVKPAGRNPGVTLGAILGVAATEGRDKLTILADEPLKSFGSWLEQLIAESSGKEGKGILPVDLEPFSDQTNYGEDRLFVYLKNSDQLRAEVLNLHDTGIPCLVVSMAEPASISAEMYRWEFAIATACHILEVNAFDQPNVEDHKTRTKVILEEQIKTGHIELPAKALESDGTEIYSNVETSGTNIKECIKSFVVNSKPHEFIAINAFVPRDGNNLEVLTQLRINIRNSTKCATTLGFGPRYLHSTGQLHKGGANNGKFLIITVKPEKDLQIPTQELTFGELELTQALGEYQALNARNRQVMWINLPAMKDLRLLNEAFS